jgi:AraC family transcriptional activator of tynA and feaB
MGAAAEAGFAQRSRGGSLDSTYLGGVATLAHPRGDIEWYAAWGDPGSAYQFSFRSVSGSGLVIDSCYAGTGVRASRGRSATRRARSDWLVLSAPLAGSVEVSWRNRDARLRPGQFGLVSSTEPLVFRIPKRVHSLTAFLPPEILDELTPDVGAALGRALPVNPAFQLLLQHLKLTLALGPSLDGRACQAATRAAWELLAAALSSADPEAAECHDDVRIAAVKDYIDRSLAAPSLSVDQVAAANFISLRTLHRLFNATDETASAYIRRRRLEMCRADILANPALPIGEICPRWGLTDGSHLARQFRVQFGASPQQIRVQATRGSIASVGE